MVLPRSLRRRTANAAAIAGSAAATVAAATVAGGLFSLAGWPPRLIQRLGVIGVADAHWGARWEALARPASTYQDTALRALSNAGGQLLAGVVGIALLSLILHALSRILADWHGLAVRSALGAPYRALVRRVGGDLLELGGLGSAAGALGGALALGVLAATRPALLTAEGGATSAVLGAVGSTALVALILGSLATVMMVLLQRGVRTMQELHGSQVTAGGGVLLAHATLGALQVAGLLVVLYGSALVVRGAAVAGHAPASPPAITLTTMRIAGTSPAAVRAAFWRQLLAPRHPTRAAASPGTWQGLGKELPLIGLCGDCFVGNVLTPVTGATVRAESLTPGTLTLLGSPVTAGRDIGWQDTVRARPVVILSRVAAARLFPGSTALGKRVRAGLTPADDYTVIGVASSRAPRGLGSAGDGAAVAWFALLQHPPDVAEVIDAGPVDAPPAAADGRAGAVSAVESLASRWRASAAPLAWFGALFSGLAGGSGLIATAALAALMAQLVALRRRDIAIRRALGAHHRHILWWLAGRAGGITVAGVLVGLSLARWLGESMHGTLTRSTLDDLWVLLLLTGGLIGLGSLIGLSPARRAIRVEPATILGATE